MIFDRYPNAEGDPISQDPLQGELGTKRQYQIYNTQWYPHSERSYIYKGAIRKKSDPDIRRGIRKKTGIIFFWAINV